MEQRLGHSIVLRLATSVAATVCILGSDVHAGEPAEIVISQTIRSEGARSTRVDQAWADTRLREELDARLAERFAISRADTCDKGDSPCGSARARRRHATWLVRATLVSVSGDHRVLLEVVRPSDGYTAASVDETCEICGRAELDGFFASVVGTLLVRLEALEHVPSTAAPAPAPARATRRVSPLAIAGWASLAVGATAGVSGGVLWGLDGRPHRGSCGEPDAQDECPNLYSSRAAGIALVATGVSALTLGATLLVVDRVRSRRGRARERARVQWSGGARLRWSL